MTAIANNEAPRDSADVVELESVAPDAHQDPTEPTRFVFTFPRVTWESSSGGIELPDIPQITCQEQAEDAAELRKKVGTGIKSARAGFKPTKDALNDAKAALLALEEKVVGPAQAFYDGMGRAIDDYQAAERRRAAAVAKQKLEDDRKRKEEERLAEAEQLEAAGHTAAAAETVAEEVIVETVAAAAPKIAGFRTKPEDWKAKVFDEAAFYKACAENPALRIHAPIDLKTFKAQAKQWKGSNANPFPGIKFYNANA